jgi:KipI family sensor histidine kinase inhibitor
MTNVFFYPLGESALHIEIDDHENANALTLDLAAALEAMPPNGLQNATPAISSLLLRFDPLLTRHNTLEREIRQLATSLAARARPGPRYIEIDVSYGASDGPDLGEVAAALGLDESEWIALHTANVYRVMMIGFAPGYPYIGPLPPTLQLPRRSTPRSAVPAGSVAIAAGLTGIYPARLPGGWHIVGRTEACLFDATADPPTLLQAGDTVRFRAL